MKKENTNGLAGKEKGWQACGTVSEIGVIQGYDPATYTKVVGGLTSKIESNILRKVGRWMWSDKEEAVTAILEASKEAL